jgi:hypothetical protein
MQLSLRCCPKKYIIINTCLFSLVVGVPLLTGEKIPIFKENSNYGKPHNMSNTKKRKPTKAPNARRTTIEFSNPQKVTHKRSILPLFTNAQTNVCTYIFQFIIKYSHTDFSQRAVK